MKVFFENTLSGHCSTAILAKYLRTKNTKMFFPQENNFTAPCYPIEKINNGETIYIIAHNIGNCNMVDYIKDLCRKNCFVVALGTGDPDCLHRLPLIYHENIDYFGFADEKKHGSIATLPMAVWKYCNCFALRESDFGTPYFIKYLSINNDFNDSEYFNKKDREAFLEGLLAVNYFYDSKIWNELFYDVMFLDGNPYNYPEYHLKLVELGKKIQEDIYYEYKHE